MSGIFIDFSNLFWAIKKKNPITGERINYDIDFIKLHEYLKERHSPDFYNVYACQDTQPRQPYVAKAANHIRFLDFLDSSGFAVIRKELKHMKSGTKCDTDIEITMDLHRYIDKIDTIVLFTGDSDFLAALRYFESLGKTIHIYAFKDSLAWELRSFALQNVRCSFTFLDDHRDMLERVRD